MFTSFSKLMAVPSSSRIAPTRPGRPKPGRLGASATAPRRGSMTPAAPTVAWVTWRQRMPASPATSCAIVPICSISVAELRARARSSRRATIVPVMSAAAARTQWRPTSMPTTQPADGFSS